MALFFVVCLSLGILVTVKAVRAVKSGVERAGVQVRRSVDEAALRAKATRPDIVGDVVRTRLELRRSIDGTRRELEARVATDSSLSESLSLLDQLHDHARQLDRELGLLEAEPDSRRVRVALPQLRERVDIVRESADSLRHAAQDRARRFDEEGLAALRQQISVEAGALRSWSDDQEPLAAAEPSKERESEPSSGRAMGSDPKRALGRDQADRTEGTGLNFSKDWPSQSA
ncbi:hypothetical protein [Streptomyces sp. NPDC005438]|uniref:hypothetical protein n=1 Tax=Streptomyces sp. NPDC005438 TaxID=3156880 RepID=UPI0033B9F44C